LKRQGNKSRESKGNIDVTKRGSELMLQKEECRSNVFITRRGQMCDMWRCCPEIVTDRDEFCCDAVSSRLGAV